MSLYEELKRRQVFRVAVLYAGIAWIVLQAASMALPAFHAPDWVFRTLIIVGLIGFVVVSGIDNVIKPMLLRDSAEIHPLLGFLAILGGVLAFGVFGFLIGPVILSLVLSAMRIYKLDVLRGPTLAAPAAPGNPPAAA